jgi:hypothetical protein
VPPPPTFFKSEKSKERKKYFLNKRPLFSGKKMPFSQ